MVVAPIKIDTGYSTELAAKLGGVTTEALHTWHRTGFLSPTVPGRRGKPRRYTFRDVVAVRVASQLRAAGMTVASLRRVIRYICKAKGLSTTEALASTRLVTDGTDVFEVTDDQSVSTLCRPGQRLLFVVPLGEYVAELQTNARKLADSPALGAERAAS